MIISPVVKFTDIQIKSYMKQLLTGMDFMHMNKILHRDIKSQNLFITRLYFLFHDYHFHHYIFTIETMC